MSDATNRPPADDDRPSGEAAAKLDNVRPAHPDAQPDPDEIVVEDDSAPAAGTVPPTRPARPDAAFGGERVVYRDVPIPPKPHSNRTVGVLLAGVGALAFAALYAVAMAMVIAVFPDAFGGAGFGEFVSDAAFWVPVLLFTLCFVLIVLLLNRAAWSLHVLASLLVAAVVYFGTVGIALLLNLATGTNPDAGFATFGAAPFVLVATAVAREIAIWVGLLIARRGVRLAGRNAEERTTFEQEHGTGDRDARPATGAA